MRSAWSWLGVHLERRLGVVSLVGLILTVALGFGATRLDFATGESSYLNESDPAYVANQTYEDLFGGDAVLTLYTMDQGATVADLITSGDNEAMLEALAEELRGIDGVDGVITPLTVLQFTENLVTSESGDITESIAGRALLSARERDPDPESAARRAEDALATLARAEAVPEGERAFDNPDWVAFLLHDNQGEIRKSLRPFFPDDRHAQTVVRLDGDLTTDEAGEVASRVRDLTTSPDAALESASVVTTGAPLLLQQLSEYLRSGIVTLGALAVLFTVLILLILFDVRWRLLPLGVVLIGVLWAFGVAGYLGIPLSVVTIAGLPVMLGVGVDYAVQMHSRIEEEVLLDRAEHPIQETGQRLGPGLLMVMASAVLAFLALRFAAVPMIRDFGLLLAVGIVAICLCSILVPMTILGVRESRSPTVEEKGWFGTREALGRLVVRLGRLIPPRAGGALTVAAVVIFAGGALAQSGLDLESDPEQWVDQDSEVIQDIGVLRKETGAASELGVFVRSGDPFSDETVAYVHDLAVRELEERPEHLLSVSSLVTTVSFALEVPGTTSLPPRGEDVAAAYEVAPPDIRLATVNPDADALNMIFRTGAGPLEERAGHIDEISAGLDEAPPGIEAQPAGLAVVAAGLLENLRDNRALLTYLPVVFVLAFLTVAFRSLVRSLLALVPVLIAVGLATLGAWAAGIRLSPMTVVVGPLVVAVCTEFTTLILLRYLEERGRDLGPQQAIAEAARRTGRAFTVSAVTGIAGVAVIAQSSQPILRDFGLVVALDVAVALASALVVLPPMLIWADRRGWVSGGVAGAGPAEPAG